MFKKTFEKIRMHYLEIVLVIVFVLSWTLALHNIPLYHYSHGFDGPDHVKYIEYVTKHWSIPPTSYSTETHQPPLYYFLAAIVAKIFGSIKSAQYLNIFILWGIIGVSAVGMYKVFQNKTGTTIGIISLASLPMLNIFPSMYGNELLNTFLIVCCLVSCLYLSSATTNKQILTSLAGFSLFFILGIWTKVSIITTLPIFCLSSYFLFKDRTIDFYFLLKSTIFFILIIGIFSFPIFFRTSSTKSQSNIILVATRDTKRQPAEFFYRIDWIWNLDISKTQYYSLWGGAWNSFWIDGQNAVTPFLDFNKKAFVLWMFGFVILPLCIFGYQRNSEPSRKLNRYKYILIAIALTNLLFYVFFNYQTHHYSAVRLTYEMGIIISYSFGLGLLGKHKRLSVVIVLLLLIQFLTMFSYYWIDPSWHLTKPVDFSQFKN